METIQQLSDQTSHATMLTQITRELTGLVNMEMEQLQQDRPTKILDFQERKLSLSAAYDTEIKAIGLGGGLKAAGSGEVLRTLKQETRLFQKALERHGRMIKALKSVSENMILAISDEVSRQQAFTRSYGADARMSDHRSSKTPTTLALNKTV